MSSITLSLALRGRLLSGTQTTLQGALFGNGEPGFTFEPWDITTLYQDRAGTTPVTAAGQSVGLRLDKSKGLALGPELVTNGDFSADTGWTLGGNWSISGGTLNGAAATSYSYIQAIGLNPSKTYRLLVSVTVSIGSVAINLGGINEVAFTSSGQKTATLLLDPSAIPFVYVSGSNFTGTIDNISVRELSGNHEVAINDASRGIYGWMPKTGRRNLLTYTEQFDNAAWTKSATVTVTSNSATSPIGDMTADTVSFSDISQSLVGSTTTSISGLVVTGSIYVKGVAGETIQIAAGGLDELFTLNGQWQRLSLTKTAITDTINAFNINTFGGATARVVNIWGAQLETGSTATAYQRVNSQYDITEAGVPTCYYVQADGVDDAYVTPTITPNTDKAQVFAGVRKNSDAATGMLFETSTNADSNTGAWYLALLSGGNWQPQTGPVGSRTYTPYFLGAAPKTSVLTVTIDNAVAGAGEIDLRENGQAKIGSAIVDGGATGNFLAYPAYIYARGGTSLPFNGLDFGHAVRFGPNLDAATIARVEALIARNTPEVTL